MSPTSAPLGDGEIARALERLEKGQHESRTETRTGLEQINVKLDNRPTWADLDRVTAVMQKDIDGLREEVDGLQDDSKWSTRAIVGAFIVGLAGLLWSGPTPLP